MTQGTLQPIISSRIEFLVDALGSATKVVEHLHVSRPLLRRRRSAVVNHELRMTGDAIIHVVAALAGARKTAGRDELQAVIDRFIESQVLLRIFGSELPVSSPKSFLGHTLGAAQFLEFQRLVLHRQFMATFPLAIQPLQNLGC